MANPGSESRTTAASAFWWRLTDNLFRGLLWLLLPILVFGALGVLQASGMRALYLSDGVLSAASNPLVPDQQLAGTTVQYWETPADAVSRTINEQLRTDRFMSEVADQAGLADQIDQGLITVGIVRQSVWSTANGSSLVELHASWGDPQTAHALVQGAISSYKAFLVEQVTSNVKEAVTFYKSQLDDLQKAVESAEGDLDRFAGGISPNRDTTLVETLQIQRLTDAVGAAQGKVVDAENQIESAEFALTQAERDASSSLQIIDPPEVPTSPQSTLIDQAMTTIAYTMLGVLVSAALLFAMTVVDQSVASVSDLSVAPVEIVAVVPALALASRRDNRRGRQFVPSARNLDRAPVDTAVG